MRRRPKYLILGVSKLGPYERERDKGRKEEEGRRKKRRRRKSKFGSMKFLFGTIIFVCMEPMYGFIG